MGHHKGRKACSENIQTDKDEIGLGETELCRVFREACHALAASLQRG